MTLTGLLVLVSGAFIITLACIPSLNRRIRGLEIYYGWLILAMAFLASFAATGTTQVVLGGIQVALDHRAGRIAPYPFRSPLAPGSQGCWPLLPAGWPTVTAPAG